MRRKNTGHIILSYLANEVSNFAAEQDNISNPEALLNDNQMSFGIEKIAMSPGEWTPLKF